MKTHIKQIKTQMKHIKAHIKQIKTHINSSYATIWSNLIGKLKEIATRTGLEGSQGPRVLYGRRRVYKCGPGDPCPVIYMAVGN
jgi:hypothetical protein